jgi:hypothetical protein
VGIDSEYRQAIVRTRNRESKGIDSINSTAVDVVKALYNSTVAFSKTYGSCWRLSNLLQIKISHPYVGGGEAAADVDH